MDISMRLIRRNLSFLRNVPLAAPDAILGLNTAFKADTNPYKVNLGVGAYRSNEGKPYVLESVRKAEQIILNSSLDHEYSSIDGDTDFLKLALVFAYGRDCEALKSKQIAAVQTLSGTGACRVFAEFIARFAPSKNIYLPDPTWGNHHAIMKAGGLTLFKYRYYNSRDKSFDFHGLKEDVLKAPNQSSFLLHSCAHNPTG